MLEHHTDLGAGYRIALKDLELRGAGQPAGRGTVGAGPRGRLRPLPAMAGGDGAGAPGPGRAREPSRRPRWCSTVRPTCRTPSWRDDDTKLDLYRRLARAETPGEIDGLRAELRERFGPLPVEAETLLDMARLRVLGATLGHPARPDPGRRGPADIPGRRGAADGEAQYGARRCAAGGRGATHRAAGPATRAAGRRSVDARTGAGAAGGGLTGPP